MSPITMSHSSPQLPNFTWPADTHASPWTQKLASWLCCLQERGCAAQVKDLFGRRVLTSQDMHGAARHHSKVSGLLSFSPPSFFVGSKKTLHLYPRLSVGLVCPVMKIHHGPVGRATTMDYCLFLQCVIIIDIFWDGVVCLLGFPWKEQD